LQLFFWWQLLNGWFNFGDRAHGKNLANASPERKFRGGGFSFTTNVAGGPTEPPKSLPSPSRTVIWRMTVGINSFSLPHENTEPTCADSTIQAIPIGSLPPEWGLLISIDLDSEGVRVFDVSDPTRPRSVGGFHTAKAGRMVIRDNLVYLADSSCWGLSVLEFYAEIVKDQTFTAWWPAELGKSYVLQAKEKVTDCCWSGVVTNRASVGSIKLTDTAATGAHRFYRVVVAPWLPALLTRFLTAGHPSGSRSLLEHTLGFGLKDAN
jgi:hypothetical protein